MCLVPKFEAINCFILLIVCRYYFHLFFSHIFKYYPYLISNLKIILLNIYSKLRLFKTTKFFISFSIPPKKKTQILLNIIFFSFFILLYFVCFRHQPIYWKWNKPVWTIYSPSAPASNAAVSTTEFHLREQCRCAAKTSHSI